MSEPEDYPEHWIQVHEASAGQTDLFNDFASVLRDMGIDVFNDDELAEEKELGDFGLFIILEKLGTEDKEETEDYIATIELSAKGVQQEHGISFEDACWVVDKMRDSNETNESLSFSEDYFVDEIKGKNEGRD
jgi:predicted metal-dependent phosphotriesterase family hydrolase